MDFRDWIRKYEGKDNPVGDLADDIKRDRNFPEENDFDAIYDYLSDASGFRIRHKVLRTFREAWVSYAKQCGMKLLSEATIEYNFCKKIEKIGGISVKFTPAGWSGAPDRIVLLPGGIVKFVEFKVLGAEPRALQKLRLTQLRSLGFEAYVIDSIRDVNAFVDLVTQEIDAVPEELEKLDYDAIEGVFRL